MNKEQKILLDLLADRLFGKDAGEIRLSGDEWQAVMHEAKQQTVTRIAFKAAEKYDIPDDIRSKWRMLSEMSFSTAVINEKDHCDLHRWLTDAGINYVILKGCSSSYYYPVPLDRGMGDIDFLVQEKDKEKASRLLEEKGFTASGTGQSHHIAFHKGRTICELHFDIPGVPKGVPGEIVHGLVADIMDRSFEYKTQNGTMLLSSVFHHGLVNILHICIHLTGTGVGLRHLCDWAVFVDSMSDEDFSAMFGDSFRKIGIWKFAAVLTRICEQYLGCRHKPCFDGCGAEELSDRLIEDILFNGNFGRKNLNAGIEAHLISTKQRLEKNRKNKLYLVIKKMNCRVRYFWPAAAKVPLLLPFGWIYLVVRKIFRSLKRNKKLPSVKTAAQHASERQDVYDRLDLFTPGK